jgi:hypothetical protein
MLPDLAARLRAYVLARLRPSGGVEVVGTARERML